MAKAARTLGVITAAALALALPGIEVGAGMGVGVEVASASTPPAGVHVLGGGFDNPDAVATNGTHVWVANASNNTVSELSARTGQYTKTLLGSAYGFDQPDSVAVTGPDVWVANRAGNSLTEISAATGAAVRVISGTTAGFGSPTKVISAGKDLWVIGLTGDTSSVTELDASSGALVRTIPAPTAQQPVAVAANSTDVLVAYRDASSYAGSVIELSASSGKVVWDDSNYLYQFDSLMGIALFGSHAWVVGSNLTEVNLSNGALLDVIVDQKDKVAQPRALAVHGSDLWIGNSAGTGHATEEISAATGHLVRRIVGSREFAHVTAFAAGPTNLWVANGLGAYGNSVAELNASSGHLVRIVSGSSYQFTSLDSEAINGTHVWILDDAGTGTITELAARTGAVVRLIRGTATLAYYGLASTQPIVSDGPDLWVASRVGPSGKLAITEVSASTGKVVRVISGPSYDLFVRMAITTNGRDVWVANSNANETVSSVTEFSASTGRLVRVIRGFAYGFDAPSSIAVSGPDVWVYNSLGNSLTELSASTGKVVRVITAASYGLGGLGPVRFAGGRLWVEGNNGIDEIDPSTAALVRVMPYLGRLAADGTALWVATESSESSITEVSEATGKVVRVVSGPAYDLDSPTAIASNGTDVWVVEPTIDMVVGFPTT